MFCSDAKKELDELKNSGLLHREPIIKTNDGPSVVPSGLQSKLHTLMPSQLRIGLIRFLLKLRNTYKLLSFVPPRIPQLINHDILLLGEPIRKTSDGPSVPPWDGQQWTN